MTETGVEIGIIKMRSVTSVKGSLARSIAVRGEKMIVRMTARTIEGGRVVISDVRVRSMMIADIRENLRKKESGSETG